MYVLCFKISEIAKRNIFYLTVIYIMFDQDIKTLYHFLSFGILSHKKNHVYLLYKMVSTGQNILIICS